MIQIQLPWPSRDLSPNARVHWSKKAKAAKASKDQAYWLTKEAKAVIDWTGTIHVMLEFFQPSRRRMDLDNMLSMQKNALDGIALALGVDDSRFALHLSRAENTGGYVVVTIIKEIADKPQIYVDIPE